MKIPQEKSKVNVTVSLSRETLQKARLAAARRVTSISKLVADQIEALVCEDEVYRRAKHQALALLDKGFPLGGGVHHTRDELHER